ncbi:MAG: acyl-CoA dehydrogenase family protein, partial [Rhodobacteraceae bacterium]|nr:acyl-CoA dehydrogenase family protein [Paracoccaceae bacterium]
MARDGTEMAGDVVLADLRETTAATLAPVEELLKAATERLRAEVVVDGRIAPAALEQSQSAAHALSWLATYVEALRQLQAWADRLDAAGQFGEMEQLILQIGFGEYLAQIRGGIPMSQNEIARLADFSLDGLADTPAIARLLRDGNSAAARARLVALMRDNHGRATFGATGLEDELEMIRDQFHRFAEERVAPHAHVWHLKDQLIPMEIITELAEMGVFGLT